MKDEQGAGNVFHTVKQTTMSQRHRAIPSFSNINTYILRNRNDKHVLWVINYNLKSHLGIIHLINRKFTSERHTHRIFLLLTPKKSSSLHCKSSHATTPQVWFGFNPFNSASSVKDSVKGNNVITGKMA